MADIRARVLVRGRVQGVSFRAYTQAEANSLGLKGFVRNLPDRSVEIVAEGDEESLKKLVDWAHKGPSHARVDSCDVEYGDATGEWHDFRIAY
jgi:acylphosphatase